MMATIALVAWAAAALRQSMARVMVIGTAVYAATALLAGAL